MTDGASSIYGYTFKAKRIRSSFKKILHCHELLEPMQIPRVLQSCCLFLSSQKAFRSYLMMFKCALAIWPRSLTDSHLLCVQHSCVAYRHENCMGTG